MSGSTLFRVRASTRELQIRREAMKRRVFAGKNGHRKNIGFLRQKSCDPALIILAPVLKGHEAVRSLEVRSTTCNALAHQN